MNLQSLRVPSARLSVRMRFSALVNFLLFGIFVILLQGTISAPVHAQDSNLALGRTASPVLDFSDCPMVAARITSAPDDETLATLRGNMHPLARAEFDRGAVPDDLPMEHIVMLLRRTPEQELKLQARIDRMHNRHSPFFHQWLTTQQVGSCYGVADADIARISKWLQGKGFKVDSVPAGKTLLIFSGTAGRVRDAFHTEIHTLNVKGKQHIANMSEPQIPAALAPVVAGFRSLHDFFPKPTMHVKGLVKRDSSTGKTYVVDGKGASPLQKIVPKFKRRTNVTYPHDPYSEGTVTDVGPEDFYTIYNETPLLSGTACGGAACNGAGQTIGVIEETDVCKGQTGTSPDNCNGANDLAAFDSQFALPSPPSTNYLFGITSYCSDPGVQGPNGTGEEGEADLDLQWASAVAPSANIVFVACASTSTTAGVDLSATYAVNNLATTLSSFSVSYGVCESQLPVDGFGANSFYNALWEQAAAQGQTVVISAGDSGDDVCDSNENPPNGATSGWNVNGMGSTPYDVVTGGTDFTDNYSDVGGTGVGGSYWNNNDTSPYESALSYIPETTWNGSCGSTILATDFSVLFSPATYTPEEVCNGDTEFGTFITAVDASGGGGISSVYSKPTWQSVYGVGLSTNLSSSTMRNLPDLAMFASNGIWGHALLYCESDATTPTTGGTGGDTPCNYANVNDANFMSAGGTSFVAPQINGLMAIINQFEISNSAVPQPNGQGQADYTFYALAAHEYGTTSAENTSTTEPSVLTCESNYLSIAEYSSVFPSCVFQNINRTPLIFTSSCGGTDNSNCVVDGNVMPCVTGDTDCYTATSGDAYGLLSISTSSFEPAWYQSAGYSDATGLGSLNIANLVKNWNSSTWLTQFASTSSLATSAGSITSSQSVTLTAKVTATGRGGAVSPAGVVEFFIGSTSGKLLGEGDIVQTCTGTGTSTDCDGVATLAVAGSALQAGSNSIVAYFEGDGANDAPSTSSAVTVTVTTGSSAPATMSSPKAGSVLGTSDVQFTWTAGTGVTQYQLWLGLSGPGSSSLYTSGWLTTQSTTVTSLPAKAATIYARLYSTIGGKNQYIDYTYAEAGAPATMSTPAQGSTLGTSDVKFTWTAGYGVTQYNLWLGLSGPGSSSLYTSGWLTAPATSTTVTSLPGNGVTVYARLYSTVDGKNQYVDYTYTEGESGVPATMTTPAESGSVLGTSEVPFAWTKGTNVTQYQLWLGLSGPGSSSLYASGWLTTQSTTVPSLPAKGATVYARLYSTIGGKNQYNDYTYVEQ